jgi:hypothetical protein
VDATAKTALSARRSYLSSLPSSSLAGTQQPHTPQAVSLIRTTTSPQLLASQHDYVSLFLSSYLPQGCTTSTEIPGFSTASWIIAASAAGQSHDRTHGMLRLAVIACSLCMLGFQQRDDRVLAEGRIAYGRALLQLAKGLQNMSDTNRVTLIRTARMLSLFEVSCNRIDLCYSPTTDHPPRYSSDGTTRVTLHMGKPGVFTTRASDV